MAEPGQDPFRTWASPFASKLGTNYCPVDEVEVAQINALLVEPLSRLKGLDGQIADLQKAIDELVAERDTVGAFVATHQALISPGRRLPFEIIQRIFVACLPTHRNCIMSATEAPVLLGRICSSWRAISLVTPRLWCSLHVAEPKEDHMRQRFKEHSKEKFVQRLEITKTWLSRSGQCPLSISFQGNTQSRGDVTVTRGRSFIQAIIPFAPRWTDITLRASSSAVKLLSSITKDNVPLLQRLEVSTVEGSLPLFDAPSLTEFTVTGRHVWIEDLADIRWEGLTLLSLEVCSLMLDPDNVLVDEPGRVLVPLLQSLHITGFSQGIQTMFRRLSLRELRRLEVTSEYALDDELHTPISVEDFLTFLAISYCLERLRIGTPMFTPSSLVQLLRGLPASITCLHIADHLYPWVPTYVAGIVNDEMIAALTPTPDYPGSCPALQELQIIRCSSPSDAAVVRFIKARMTAVSPSTLTKVALKYQREKQVDIAANIQPFLENGHLEFTASYASLPAYSPWLGLPDAPETLQWCDIDF
ncbi:hypothetical protein C8R46DRAFT_1293871 [Mycena filopes]|nr:hypothetical protein C8R46DRAFT_1293871 [Mycena filopes]